MQARWLLGWDRRVMQKSWDEWTCALASCPSVRVVKVCRVARFVRAARVSLNDVWLVDSDSTFYWKGNVCVQRTLAEWLQLGRGA